MSTRNRNLTELDGYGRDVIPYHPIEDQVERGPRELNAQEREWWGEQRHRAEDIAARARHAQDLARIRRSR
jgi:hypothetical protein